MSTDGRLIRRRTRTFRRTVAATLGVLALATAGLGVASALRGPALDEAAVAAADAIQRTDQRLVLRADQVVESVDADDVTIEPAAPVDVTSDGATITLRFTGMLRTLTEYHVGVDVVGAATGVASRLDYRFSTPDLSYSLLAPAESGGDEVLRVAATTGETETLYRADGIAEFAELSYGVVAMLENDSGVPSRVVIVPSGETLEQEIALPGEGSVSDLHAASRSDLIGFVFTSADQTRADARLAQLLLFDPVAGPPLPEPVRGLDGQPVSVLDWIFVPGTPYLVVQTFDQALLLVDTTSDIPPVPLGEHTELRGFVPGTVTLVVADPLSGSIVDLSDGTTTVLDLPADDRPESDYRGQLVLIDENSYLETVSRPVSDTGFILDYEVLFVDREGATVIADPESGVFVRGVCLSPNAQFAVIQLVRSAGESSVSVVDLATGETRTLPGRAVSWCA